MRKLDEIKKENESRLNVEAWRNKNAMNILQTNFKKYRFVSFDVETIGRGNDFFLCGVIDYDGVYTCYFSKDEVIQYFKRLKHNDLIIVATNLSFDYSTIFNDSEYFNDCKFIVNNGRFISITLNGTYYRQTFFDTLNFGGMSVEQMGKVLGKPKLKKPRCLGKSPKNRSELKELIDYNMRDCEVSRDFMIYLQDTINLIGGELKATISSCALDVYRRRFQPFAVTRESVSTGLNIKDKIHLAYYGGRTETFKRGLINDYYYFDVNSLYPFCMLQEYPIPDSMIHVYNEDRSLLRFEGVSYFELDIPYTKYPLLPYRKDGKLCFPYGRIKGYYTHLEIRRAVELYGEQIILLMVDTSYYTRTHKFFKSYVEFMYSERLKAKKNDDVMQVFYKLLMNSLYGKWGQNILDNTEFFIPKSSDDVNNRIEVGTKKAKFHIVMDSISYLSEPKEFDGIYSLPIWSCYTTAYARILIHSKILETEPVYCDTDSLITKVKLVDSNKLGELKLEEYVYSAIIIKPKMYFLNEKVKVKGIRIPKDQKHLLRLKHNLVNGKPIRYEKFVKIKEGVKRGMKINSIIVVEKNVDLEDTKRDWGGKKFSPFELQDSLPLRIDDV